MSQRKSTSWSVVIAFDEISVDPRERQEESYLGDRIATLEKLCDVVDAKNVRVLSDDDQITQAAHRLGATSESRGRDLNGAITRALARWATEAPHRGAAVIVGPFPHASSTQLEDALRACAAVESACIEGRNGTTAFLTHHDPARVTPRFGGASAVRHNRTAVSVGQGLGRFGEARSAHSTSTTEASE